jgi:hypothetical protein
MLFRISTKQNKNKFKVYSAADRFEAFDRYCHNTFGQSSARLSLVAGQPIEKLMDQLIIELEPDRRIK